MPDHLLTGSRPQVSYIDVDRAGTSSSLLPFAGTDSWLLAARSSYVRLPANRAAREGLRVIVSPLACPAAGARGNGCAALAATGRWPLGIGVADWSSCCPVSPCKSRGRSTSGGEPPVYRGGDPAENLSARAARTSAGPKRSWLRIHIIRTKHIRSGPFQ